MASIFSLYGEIFVDNEKAKTSINDIKKKGEETGTSFAEKFGSIAKTTLNVGTAVVGATTTIVGGLGLMGSKYAETSKQIQVMSDRVGWNTTKYQEWEYIATQAGTSMDTLQGGITALAEKMDDAAAGGGEANEIFKKLGLTVKDENGNLKDQATMFEETILALQGMEDATQRQALASKLLSTTGEELLPLLNGEIGSVEELTSKAHELGMVMGEDAVEAGANFSESLNDIKGMFGGVFNQLAGSLIPILQTVLDLIMANMPTITNLFSTLAPIISNLLNSILPPFIQLAQTLLPVIIQLINQLLPFISTLIQAILPVVIQLLDMLLPPLLQIIELILPLLISLIEPLLPLLQPILELLQPLIDLLLELIKPLIEILNVILPPLINLITSILNFIMPALQAQLTIVASVLSSVFGGALDLIKKQISLVIDSFKNIIDFIKNVFTGNWKGAWENIKNIFSNIASGLGNIFKAPINLIIDLINGFIKGLNKIKVPDWVPGVGGKGINIPLIKKLRVGMEYVPYDEMPALLHKGEAVLDKDEADDYRRNRGKNNDDSSSVVYNNNIVIEHLEVRKESDIEDIAEELYYLQKKEVGA